MCFIDSSFVNVLILSTAVAVSILGNIVGIGLGLSSIISQKKTPFGSRKNIL
jgi:hypothetical protein